MTDLSPLQQSRALFAALEPFLSKLSTNTLERLATQLEADRYALIEVPFEYRRQSGILAARITWMMERRDFAAE